MSKITTTEEADAFVKQNASGITSLNNAIPVVTGEPNVIEGEDIKYWRILFSNPEKPDKEPQPLMGSEKFLADNGQIISKGVTPNPQPFKDWFLEQYDRNA